MMNVDYNDNQKVTALTLRHSVTVTTQDKSNVQVK